MVVSRRSGTAGMAVAEADLVVRTVARAMAGSRDVLRHFADVFRSLRSATTLFLLYEVKPGYAVPIGS